MKNSSMLSAIYFAWHFKGSVVACWVKYSADKILKCWFCSYFSKKKGVDILSKLLGFNSAIGKYFLSQY